MPNLVAISQTTTEIKRGRNPPPLHALSVSNHPGQIEFSHKSSKSVQCSVYRGLSKLHKFISAHMVAQSKLNLIYEIVVPYSIICGFTFQARKD